MIKQQAECCLADTEKTVMNNKTLKFAAMSNEFALLFGFNRTELHSMRPVLGPQTNLNAMHMAMSLCSEFNHPVSIPVLLYNRAADPINMVVEFTQIDDQYVVLQCRPLLH
jgi:hypothetical protein